MEFNSYEKPAAEAMSHLKQYMQDNRAWFYINGRIANINEITVDTLKHAKRITITNVILAG